MDIDNLLDTYHRECAITAMRDWVKYPDHQKSDGRIQTIEQECLVPLTKWTDKEFRKNNNHHTAATEAASNFIVTVEDLIYSLKHKEDLHLDACVSAIERTWKEFQLEMGWDNAVTVEGQAPFVKKWEKQLRDVSRGGKTRATNPEKVSNWKSEYQRLKKKGHSKRSAAEIISKNTGGNAETIRKLI